MILSGKTSNLKKKGRHPASFNLIEFDEYNTDREVVRVKRNTINKKNSRKKVQVGNDQEKAQSEKDSHSKN